MNLKIRREENLAKRGGTWSFVMLFFSPVAAFYGLEWMTHNPWEVMTLRVQLWNILFYEMVYFLLFFLTRRSRTAVIGGSLFFLIVGLINYFVVDFRSSPLVPWDIFSLRTAASVAGNYEYHITLSCGIVILLYALLMVGGIFCTYRLPQGIPGQRMLLALATLCLLGLYTGLLHRDSFAKGLGLDTTLFTPYYMAKRDGFTTAFLLDLQYLTVEMPEGYSAEEAEELLSSYEEETEAAHTPNLIVIMDETFSDPAVLGDFDTNTDYMPFVHSLLQGSENVLSGFLHVSVKGGNTANTEYEFLTGNTMRFLPAGSIPYQQYIFSDKYSLVSWLSRLGYATASLHPFNSTGWNRDKVYEYFGFGDILFNSAFSNPERIRKYISDEACFDRIRTLYEEKEEGTPLFCFAVTMQNHGGYNDDYDNFTVDVQADLSSCGRLNRYLSLMKISDQALEDLISYFSEEEEETVIVFFGDHQPNDNVVEPILNHAGKSGDTLTSEEEQLRYEVPFIVWANYDIGEAAGLETSANYLAAQVLSAAGLPLSSYEQYLLELSQQLPVVSALQLTDAAGEQLTDGDADALQDYRILQYYEMYGHDRE